MSRSVTNHPALPCSVFHCFIPVFANSKSKISVQFMPNFYACWLLLCKRYYAKTKKWQNIGKCSGVLAVHQEKNFFFLIFEWQNGVRLKHYTGNVFRLQWASGIFPFTMVVWWRVKPCHRMHAFQPASSTLTMNWFFQKLMWKKIHCIYRVWHIIQKILIDNGCLYFAICMT